MLEVNYAWSSTGSSGGLTAIQLDGFQIQSVLTAQCSTIASTQSFRFETAQESTGPWFNEASTALAGTATASAQANLRLTGPYTWMRPYIQSASTGTYQFRLIAAA